MSIFLDNLTVQSLVKKAQKLKFKQFSDVTDDNGHQYVDLVQEGGGVLGIALVGYTYILEQAGIRFFHLAGTSAGAINTMMMASMGTVDLAKSEKILKVLSNKNLFDFVDGTPQTRKLIQHFVDGNKFSIKLVWSILKSWNILKKNLGLNPGNEFENWLNEILLQNNIFNTSDLLKLRKKLPKLTYNNKKYSVKEAKITIISSDITTNTKVEFPAMNKLYWKNPNDVSPAKFVRASMSVPFFFNPMEITDIPNAGKSRVAIWKNTVSYNGPIPNSIKFIDGGMLSNFPINSFHTPGVPKKPTFGVRLSTYRNSYNKVDKISNFAGSMISTMRQIYDYEFIVKNPDYRNLICGIDANINFNWLNFNMTQEKQVELFTLGAKKALTFLNEFNWNEYKKIRKKLTI